MELHFTRARPVRFLWKNLTSACTWRNNPIKTVPFWLRGFSSESALHYRLTRQTVGEYPPDLFQYRATFGTNPYLWPILHDKLLFDAYFGPVVPTPRVQVAILNGAPFGGQLEGELEGVLDQLRSGMDFVVKPLRGGGGQGVHFLSGGPTGPTLDGVETTVDSVAKWFGTLPYHGLYERVQQHAVTAELFPEALNTFRVLVYRDLEGIHRVFAPVLRVGTASSKPTDSCSLGGISCLIDPDSGRIASAVSRSPDGGQHAFERHPDSGTMLVGLEVPQWKQVTDLLLSIHSANPSLDLVGWDVALSEAGPVIIEGNHNPGMKAQLIHASLRSDSRLWAMLKSRRLVWGSSHED